MTIIGLTGPSGAGKSTIAQMLCDRGFYIIDGDVTAREITDIGSPVLEKLAQEFGRDIIADDGQLKRALLAQRAFSSPECTNRLNEITHPAITEKIFDKIRTAAEKGYGVCVIDAAALHESGIAPRCSLIVAVLAPTAIRLKRIVARDGISEQTAMHRINAQKSEEYYREFADIIIMNDGTLSIEKEVDTLCEHIEQRFGRE